MNDVIKLIESFGWTVDVTEYNYKFFDETGEYSFAMPVAEDDKKILSRLRDKCPPFQKYLAQIKAEKEAKNMPLVPASSTQTKNVKQTSKVVYEDFGYLILRLATDKNHEHVYDVIGNKLVVDFHEGNITIGVTKRKFKHNGFVTIRYDDGETHVVKCPLRTVEKLLFGVNI